ncbi:MBL fold metallo-hydrolase [Candidatus Dojkabacteria bacterium]|nr:MBL fold metallo-hydrolase [Candidatus Dojkabacteria bacterium]
MEIQTIITGQLQTNCYIASDPESQKCIVIDPGDGADVISDYILTHNLSPHLVIATHGHFDHVLAAYELQMAFEIPFVIHKADEVLLSKMKSSAQHWLQMTIDVPPPNIDDVLEDGGIIEFGKSSLTVLHTPGHTPGSICLYNENEKIVFTGDTIFKSGVGRTDLSYSSKPQLEKSLQTIIQRFSGYQAYPGHEENFIIQESSGITQPDTAIL